MSKNVPRHILDKAERAAMEFVAANEDTRWTTRGLLNAAITAAWDDIKLSDEEVDN